MGKVSPKEKESKVPKQKRRTRSSKNRYLRPGALAQLRYSKASSTKSCTDLGKKRIVLSNSKKADNNDLVTEQRVAPAPAPAPTPVQEIPVMMSPQKFGFPTVSSPIDFLRQHSLPGTPKTPGPENCNFESRFESLPMDALVFILCKLHHDQLKAVFHVSQRIRKAVIIARQFYFNFTTPDRSRQEMLRTMTPLATEHWPFASKGEGKGFWLPSPHTPKAPRHGPRPPSRLKDIEMKPVAAALFQEASLPSRCIVPSVLPKPICKNRVLFYEEELCQAVAQNKLR